MNQTFQQRAARLELAVHDLTLAVDALKSHSANAGAIAHIIAALRAIKERRDALELEFEAAERVR